ncbi:MAG: ATP-dependent helicase, partial [Planctomycetaceae bacterium]|nr:ATP-dependent helicase [Planctomycetaceae bacterium]
MELVITPHGRLVVREKTHTEGANAQDVQGSSLILQAFAESESRGLLHLATFDLNATFPPALDFARQFARAYLTRLCQTTLDESTKTIPPIELPDGEAGTWLLQAPPMPGLEYLSTELLSRWWADLDTLVRQEIQQHAGGAQAYLSEKNPLWRFVGRVTLHLAENKRDPESPFAFLATYTSRISSAGRVQHEPLGRALQNLSGVKNRGALLSLLVPIHNAAEKSPLIKELVESNEIYSPLAWSPREAYRFLQEVPALEEAGLIVRLPDWWKSNRPPKPVVNVKIDGKGKSTLGVDSLLDFQVGVALDGDPLTKAELNEILASTEGLVQLKGKWVEVDREKLKEALKHWKDVEQLTRHDGLTFFQGMRLLAGLPLGTGDGATDALATTQDWSGLTAGPVLEETLARLRAPEEMGNTEPTGLQATLRPYQQTGWNWLRFLTRLGLGACLADDMGLGKTIQVIALLLDDQKASRSRKQHRLPSLLVVPASLIANWKSEIERFAPALTFAVIHPSELSSSNKTQEPADVEGRDVAITTYGMLTRTDWLREAQWNLVILDEAQAIKNSGTRQTRAVKQLQARSRIALTGTPVENRLSDLWSLFDFLNPGLLGGSKEFGKLVKQMESGTQADYRPLRRLIQPYILRRLKTDKRVIADLPEKTEVTTFCSLSRRQAALYADAVEDLARKLKEAKEDGIQRKGLVLAQLMRLKQICNHPAQMLGTGDYDPDQSGKFERLEALCEEMAERQEKVLVFTQFREMTDPIARFLTRIFDRSGLVLHGGTTVNQRREFVNQFQHPDGPPFFILSLKAGGTGLNLTEASHVIHFDRWWNPAVENQATDRAFRIGQKRNVLVHKFVCRGTVEEKIDFLISQKQSLSNNIVEGSAETQLTEMTNEELLKF